MIGRVIQLVAAVGGVGAVLVALSAWIGKMIAEKLLERDRQRHNAELERLRAELESSIRKMQGQIDRTVFVHRVQFEKEFEALSKIWIQVAELRSVFEAFSMRPRDRSDDAAWNQQIDDVIVPRFTAFLEAVDNESPFYPQNIFTCLSDAVQAARTELTLARAESPDDVPDYYKQRRAARKDFERRAKEISGLIRGRLEKLKHRNRKRARKVSQRWVNCDNAATSGGSGTTAPGSGTRKAPGARKRARRSTS